MLNKNLRRIIGLIVVSGFIIYIVLQLVGSLEKLRSYKWHLNLELILLGIFFLLGANFMGSFIWRNLLYHLGININRSNALYIWNTSRLGRYIPGKIWQFLGRVYLAKGFNKALIIWSMGIESVLNMLSGFLWAGIGTIFLGSSVYSFLPKHLILLIVPGILISIIIIHPQIMKKILVKFVNIESEIASPDYPRLLLWLLLYVILWAMRITAFWLIFLSININVNWIYIAGIFSISWIVGFITPFAPGGLGVREGIMTFLFTPILGAGFASLVSILTRAAGLTGEGITVILALLINLKYGKSSQ